MTEALVIRLDWIPTATDLMIHPIAAALCTAANSFLCTTQHHGTPGFAPSSPSSRLHLERVRLRSRHQRLEDSLSSRAMRFHLHRNVNIATLFQLNLASPSSSILLVSPALPGSLVPLSSSVSIHVTAPSISLLSIKEKKKVTAGPLVGDQFPISQFSQTLAHVFSYLSCF